MCISSSGRKDYFKEHVKLEISEIKPGSNRKFLFHFSPRIYSSPNAFIRHSLELKVKVKTFVIGIHKDDISCQKVE